MSADRCNGYRHLVARLDPQSGVIWENGIPRVIPAPPGLVTTHGLAINNTGQVVGWAGNGSGNPATMVMRAFFYDGTASRDLGTLGGRVSQANAINASGQVVGW